MVFYDDNYVSFQYTYRTTDEYKSLNGTDYVHISKGEYISDEQLGDEKKPAEQAKSLIDEEFDFDSAKFGYLTVSFYDGDRPTYYNVLGCTKSEELINECSLTYAHQILDSLPEGSNLYY